MRLSGRKACSPLPRWTTRPRLVLFGLLALNLIGFVAQELLEIYQPGTIPEFLGLSYRGIDDAYAWQFFTAIFLHGNVFLFAAEMAVLFYLGRDLEQIFGQKHFLYLYLLGAIGGELGHLFLMPRTTVLLAGAGGIAAIVVAFAITLPELEIAGSLSFLFPLKFKAKYFSATLFFLALLLIVVDRYGIVSHSALLGGCAVGWLYANLLGFGRPSFIHRGLQRRRLRRERREQMSAEEFIVEEIDPVLEKIFRRGVGSLNRRERRLLKQARAKMSGAPQ